jgi:hypothetical protein
MLFRLQEEGGAFREIASGKFLPGIQFQEDFLGAHLCAGFARSWEALTPASRIFSSPGSISRDYLRMPSFPITVL